MEDVDHNVSDSDNDEKEDELTNNSSSDTLTIGIFPSHQSPIYLHMPTKQDKVSTHKHRNISWRSRVVVLAEYFALFFIASILRL